MNIRELFIYIKNYIVNTYYYRVIPIITISVVVFLAFVAVHYIKYKSLKGTSPLRWMAKMMLAIVIATLVGTMLLRGISVSEQQWRLQPFASYYYMIENRSMGTLAQIIMNITACVPLGILLPCCFQQFEKWKNMILVVLICFGGVELIQGITRIGLFEVDDIINNVLGAIIGMILKKSLDRRSFLTSKHETRDSKVYK